MLVMQIMVGVVHWRHLVDEMSPSFEDRISAVSCCELIYGGF